MLRLVGVRTTGSSGVSLSLPPPQPTIRAATAAAIPDITQGLRIVFTLSPAGVGKTAQCSQAP
jgi:hypothetical protein